MKIVGLMLVRNEDWVIKASLDAAFRWCDDVVLYADRCTDRTVEIAHEVGRKTWRGQLRFQNDPLPAWNEMDMRQETLAMGRKMGGTHFAIIDGDEILTHNFQSDVRSWFEHLLPGQLLEVPMVPVWSSLDLWRANDPTWSTAKLTLGFCDAPDLAWTAAADGYQHHARAPKNSMPHALRPVQPCTPDQGGVMHLQFANQRRLLSKHVLYRMVDHLRWPGRESIDHLNWKYDLALKPSGELVSVPSAWWGSYDKAAVDLLGIPWQDAEIRRLLDAHGRRAFEGLDLKGYA